MLWYSYLHEFAAKLMQFFLPFFLVTVNALLFRLKNSATDLLLTVEQGCLTGDSLWFQLPEFQADR